MSKARLTTRICACLQPTTKPCPIVCTVAKAAQHPGDLIKLENQNVEGSGSDYYVYQVVEMIVPMCFSPMEQRKSCCLGSNMI